MGYHKVRNRAGRTCPASWLSISTLSVKLQHVELQIVLRGETCGEVARLLYQIHNPCIRSRDIAVVLAFSNLLIIHEKKTKKEEGWICDPNYHKIL